MNADEQAAASDAAERFTAAMDDDFNTPIALAALFDLARDLNRAKSDQPAEAPRLAGELKRLAGVLGLLQQTPQTFLKGAQQQVALSEEEIEAKSPSDKRRKEVRILPALMLFVMSWQRLALFSKILGKEPPG